MIVQRTHRRFFADPWNLEDVGNCGRAARKLARPATGEPEALLSARSCPRSPARGVVTRRAAAKRRSRRRRLDGLATTTSDRALLCRLQLGCDGDFQYLTAPRVDPSVSPLVQTVELLALVAEPLVLVAAPVATDKVRAA